jgi:hypothetical protein
VAQDKTIGKEVGGGGILEYKDITLIKDSEEKQKVLDELINDNPTIKGGGEEQGREANNNDDNVPMKLAIPFP